MKLLMITGLGSAKDLASGNKGAFYNTLEEFHKYWDRIDIIAPRDKRQEIKDKCLFGNVFIHVSPWPLILHPIWFFKKGLEIYKEHKFDLMTVQDFPPFYNGIGARLLSSRIKAPYVLEFHHISGYPKPANLKEKIYSKPVLWRLYWKIFGSKARAVRVVNQKQTPDFLKKAGVSEEKIVYIPSMYIDLGIFKPMEFEKEYDLIFVGRLEPNKGIELLLEAIKNLKSQIPSLKCLIVGDGPLKKKLLHYCTTALQANATFYGRAINLREIAELMNKSKILIMPSYNEGGPRVVLEAMACGVPVLATNVGLVPDLADKNSVNSALANKGGIKIIDWTAEDIAKKAKELLSNKEERSRLGQAGTDIAKQFEKGAMIKNYAEWLKSLIRR